MLQISLVILLPSATTATKYDLHNMITTGSCKASSYLFLEKHGNWCGLQHGGHIQDSVDGCCYRHAACYNEVREESFLTPSQIYYDWNKGAGVRGPIGK